MSFKSCAVCVKLPLMEVLTEIAIWLKSSRDFEQGKRLFLANQKTHQGSGVLKLLLEKPNPSSYIIEKLRTELHRMYERSTLAPTPIKNPSKKIKYQPVDTTGWPADVLVFKTRAKEVHDQIKERRGQLKALAYKEDLTPRLKYDKVLSAALCLEIVELQSINFNCWARIDYYAEHKKRMPGSGHTENKWINDLFELADSNKDVRRLLYLHGNLEKSLNLKRNGSSNKLKLTNAGLDIDTAKLIKTTYIDRYEGNTKR